MPRELSVKRFAGFCAVACLAVSALLLGQPSFSNASLPVRGITDPVIAIQAARSVIDVDYVLGESPSPDREVMRLKERIGFAFIAAYTGLFLALSLLLLRSGGIGRALAPAAAVCAVAAAAFNTASNLAVLRILDVNLYDTTPAMIGSIRSAAFVTWALVAFTLLVLSAYFLRPARWLPRITGGLFIVTALMQLAGLRDGEFLILASVPAALALALIAGMTFWPRRRVRAAAAIPLLLLAAFSLRAQVKEVRSYRTHEPHDRGVLFAMAVTPGGDVLSLVPEKDGNWRLTRVQHWLERTPQERTIDVPGFQLSSGISASKVRLAYSTLLVPQDGRFAVGIASANAGIVNNIISVIDLASFAVVHTARQDGALQYFTDRSGRLVSQRIINGGAAPVLAGQPGRQRKVSLKFFALPGLAPAGDCDLAESLQGRTWIADQAGCGGSSAELLGGFDPPRQTELPSGPPCSPAGAMPGSRFRVEDCSDVHRNFWGDPVVTDQHVNVFSAASGTLTSTITLIGTISETTRDSVNSRLASLEGHDYLLVMEGGTLLKIYQLTAAR